MYTENAMAIIMLCSHIGAKKTGLKPYTALQWNNLAIKIFNSKFKEPANLSNASISELKVELDIDDIESKRIKDLLSRGINMAFALEELEHRGIYVMTKSDVKYPAKFKTLLKKNAPPIIYYSGNWDLLRFKSICIVGSRNVDDKGKDIAIKLAKKAADSKIVVISGGARGIDSVSEETTINYGGAAISILADSLTKKIMKKAIREKIDEGKLLLMSMNNPDMGFTVGSAMNRNKYVYSLSNAAFVIASDYNKGGTWAGATENIKKNWVDIYVNDIKTSKGNTELIKMGANPVSDFDDIDLIKVVSKKRNPEKNCVVGMKRACNQSQIKLNL